MPGDFVAACVRCVVAGEYDRDLQTEARDREAEARDLEAKIRDREAETRDREAETRDDVAEVRDDVAEVRDRRAKARDRARDSGDPILKRSVGFGVVDRRDRRDVSLPCRKGGLPLTQPGPAGFG